MKVSSAITRLCLSLLTIVALGGIAHVAYAALITVPQTMVYNGHLLSNTNSPITTPHTIRFSLWKSSDHIIGDTTSTGAVRTSSRNYAGWSEILTVTPDANGYFSVHLGSAVPFPDMSTFSSVELQSLFLQIEVKASPEPQSSYELLDTNPSSDTIDRSPLLSVPFSLNADMVDQHHVGTGSGALPVLGSGGLMTEQAIPGGTSAAGFVIDADGSKSSGSIDLTFGGLLGKKLSYNINANRFEFNAPLNIRGDLTVTGLINGIDITNIATSSDNSHLKASSGAGLTVSVARGDYRLNGTTTQFVGSGAVALQDNTTNYIFFTSAGLSVNTTGFPTGQSYIPVASVVTSVGSVVTVTDRRTFNSDDREKDLLLPFHPSYPGAAYVADGSENVGRLFVNSDDLTGMNYYHWVSTKTSLQDYDIVLKVTVPPNFNTWKDPAIQISYRSETGLVTDNKLDITVSDTAGNPVTLTGTAQNLMGTSWTTVDLGISGSPQWTPGHDFKIVLKLSSKDSHFIELGTLKASMKTLN
ncbi:MAG: hypothetical protein WCG83_05270 [Candidatus Peregrinibacteria bacterium]